MYKMFKNCESLTSLNLSSFNIKEEANKNFMFLQSSENFIYCINDVSFAKIESQLKDKKCAIRDYNCLNGWSELHKKIINENGKCVDNCNSTINYTYEYNGKCYSSCPKGTTILFNKNNNLVCQSFEFDEIFKMMEKEKEKETDNDYKNLLYKYCDPNAFFKKECIPYKQVQNNDYMITLIKNGISEGKMDSIIEEVLNNKKDIIETYDNITYQITTTFNQRNNEYKNISTMELEGCEEVLKNIYNIGKNDSLIIFKYEYIIPKLLIPIIGYELYHPITKQILDLGFCENNKTKINILIPVQINENEVYKHNQNDAYYKDKCNTDSNNKNADITLYDKKIIYNEKNLALCAKNCQFDGYNNSTKKVKCTCEPQFNNSLLTLDDIINKKKLINNFIDIHSSTNFDIIKCYKKFLSLISLKNNIGSYIILSIILIYIIGSFIFSFCEYKKIINIVNDILKDNGNNNTNITDINNKLNNTIKKNNKIIKINKNINIKNNVNNSKINNNINNDKSTNKLYKSKNKQMQKKIIKKTRKYNEKGVKYNDSELNVIDYKEAKKFDKRGYIEYYCSLIKTRHPLISSIIPNNDNNSLMIKICLFLFSFALSLMANSLFFTDETMHKILEDEGIFNIVYNLPKIIYSTLISTVINIIIKMLALSQDSILAIKKEKQEKNLKNEKLRDKVSKTKKNLTIKFILFFVISIILLIFFWFYIGCFCAVYKNTQIYLLKDTLLSFLLSIIIPFIKFLIPCLMRINVLKDSGRLCYNISKLFQ